MINPGLGMSEVKKNQNNEKNNKTMVDSVQLGRPLIVSIFIVLKVVARKNGVEFRQRSIVAIRCM